MKYRTGRSKFIVAAVTAGLVFAANAGVIVSESFDGSGAALNGTSADIFNAGITAAGGSSTWVADSIFLDNGTFNGARKSANLNLGSYINDARGSDTHGKFTLTATMAFPTGIQMAIGFSTLNTPATSTDFTASSGLGTINYRGTTGSPIGEMDMYAFQNTLAQDGPDGNSGNRTVSITMDFTSAYYDGATKFGRISWSDSVLGALGVNDLTVNRTVGAILLSCGNTTSSSFDNLTLSQIPEPTTISMLGFAALGMMFIRRFRR
jgi:hypothetical protein